MMNRLRREIEDNGGSIAVLDASAVNSEGTHSMNEILYAGWHGLRQLDRGMVISGIQRLNDLERIIGGSKVVVLREVVDEVRTNLDLMNHHLKFFKDTNGTRNTIYKLGQRRYERDKADLAGKLSILRNYSKQLYCFIGLVDNRDCRIGFEHSCSGFFNELTDIFIGDNSRFVKDIDGNQRRILEKITSKNHPSCAARPGDYDGKLTVDYPEYRFYMKTAMALSMKCREKSLNKLESFRNPRAQGFFLNTDRKIIASAYSLSSNHQVLVVSNDMGIKGVMDSMNRCLRAECYREKYYLKMPKALPRFYSPDIEIDESRLPASAR